VLGMSETAGAAGDQFTPVEKAQRI
jgi:hypothetical protein